jgi:hypothetical protein
MSGVPENARSPCFTAGPTWRSSMSTTCTLNSGVPWRWQWWQTSGGGCLRCWCKSHHPNKLNICWQCTLGREREYQIWWTATVGVEREWQHQWRSEQRRLWQGAQVRQTTRTSMLAYFVPDTHRWQYNVFSIHAQMITRNILSYEPTIEDYWKIYKPIGQLW